MNPVKIERQVWLRRTQSPIFKNSFLLLVSSCQLSMRILTCWWWIWELVAYRLISNWGKSKNFQAGFLEKLQSKWVADHNLSNHLERNRFGAFCQLVCTKCHQCAKANAATNVAPCGEKNASERCVDITSKWVADYNLSNHLERKRFGAFCQIVCTKCRQCAVGQCSNTCCSLWSEECEQRMSLQYNFQINIFQQILQYFCNKN